jgi:predicted ATPase/DNA-binding SARP family transcriptional activator
MGLSLTLLGPFQVTWDDRPVAFATGAARALLAYLAVEADRAHPREHLAALLWPEAAREGAATNLRQTLARVRRALPPPPAPPALEVTRQDLRFRPEGAAVDVARFEELVAACTGHAHADAARCPACLERLRAAAALYRGEFLQVLSLEQSQPFEEWTLFRREQLHQAALEALHTLARGHEARGEFEAMRRCAVRQLALDPYREEAHRQAIGALASAGQHREALAQYAACRRVLAAELGVEPATETEALAERIRTGRFAPPAVPHAAAPAPAAPPAGHLPAPRTALLGRAAEVAQVRSLFAGSPDSPAARLVTVTGAGGVGKTSLALHAADALRGGFPDGAWLVELAPLADPALVPATAAAALGVRGTAPLEALAGALADKTLLLVLDNAEHVLEACASLADRLLDACPGVRLLVTSREPLRVAGEWLLRLGPLAVPEPAEATSPDALAASPALQLFAERARAVAPDFRLTRHNAAAVGRVCARLDGLPLAIELAAARARVLAPDQIAARLDDALHLLTGGRRGAPTRQQTLRATLDWSLALLTAPERALFRRLAVFAGGFTLEAAEAVGAGPDGAEGPDAAGVEAHDVLDLLTRLVDKSLVGAAPPPDGAARYRLLETLRQYAQERLAGSGEADAVRDRHAAFYLALAEQGGEIGETVPPAWLDAAERDHDNLRAALHWFGRRSAHDQALALVSRLFWLWYLRGHMAEGHVRLREVVAAAGAAAHTPAGASVLKQAGVFARYAGDPAQARAYVEASLAVAEALGDPVRRGKSLSYLGVLAQQEGDFTTARALQEQALVLLRRAGEERATASAPDKLSQALAGVLDKLSQALAGLGEAEDARRLQEEALALRRANGDVLETGWSLVHLGDLAVDRGDLSAARRAYAECLARRSGPLPPPVLARALEGCAAAAAAAGRGARALRLLGAAAALRETSGAVTDNGSRERGQRTAEFARQQARRREAAAAWAAGRTMPLEQAVAYALKDAAPA